LKDRTTTIEARIPAATYRLQFNSRFTFKQAAGLADYLYDLGVSDCYASPLFTARCGSQRGYDITDHSKLNPEVGSEEEFAELARRLGRRGIGSILDVAPNHMSIAGSSTRWWNDVLENGHSSPYAQFFDIDWRPPKPDLAGKTLLPTPGDRYGRGLQFRRERQAMFAEGDYLHPPRAGGGRITSSPSPARRRIKPPWSRQGGFSRGSRARIRRQPGAGFGANRLWR